MTRRHQFVESYDPGGRGKDEEVYSVSENNQEAKP